MKALVFHLTVESGIYCFGSFSCMRSHFLVKDSGWTIKCSADKLEEAIDFIYSQNKSIVFGCKTPKSLRTKLIKYNLI